MTAAATVDARFTLQNRRLDVRIIGSGTGTVTSSPGGVNCPGDCGEDYLFGTNVTLTAAASAGSVFTGFLGGGCSGTGPCTVPMNAAQLVEAQFGSTTQLSCTLVTDASSCSNGPTPSIASLQSSGAACRDWCELNMPGAGMFRGCWVLTSSGTCFCRDGVLGAGGGTNAGGACN